MTISSVRYLAALLLLITIDCYAQTFEDDPTATTDGRSGPNLILTGVPFLSISPDARSGAMGEVGAAISPDANSIHWNPAKLAFLENDKGASFSYSPWLQGLVNDISLAYLSGYYRLDDRNTVGGSLRYFSLGTINLTDNEGNDNGSYNPNEFAIDGTFARKFGEDFSLGTAVRFIYSNLLNGQFTLGQQTKPGTALAADVSAFYKRETVLFNSDARFALGLNISNIGTKISYTDNASKIFIPTNLKLGTATTFLNGPGEFTVALDINKLLVPTPPRIDEKTGEIIGKDPDRSVPAGIFGSFSDAPGGFSEELQEINYSLGMEYWYDKQFALRTGFFYESPQKGNRQYLTLGAGLRYNVLNLDFAYLLASQQKSPLANTLRFSLVFNFGQSNR
ncbi:MAG TPA: type IX secretion system outer membrane channel protein PorV [Pedobacter sp.]